MHSEIKFKKLLKEEIKQILLQEGILEKLRKIFGPAIIGTTLVSALAGAGKGANTRDYTNTQYQQINNAIETSIFPQGMTLQSMRSLQGDALDRAINQTLNNIETEKSKPNLPEEIKTRLADYEQLVKNLKTGGGQD